MTQTLRTLALSAALLLAAGTASAFTLGSDVGDRVLLVSFADEDEKPSAPVEVKEALSMGGRITIDWDTAQAVDPKFFDRQVGRVFCSSDRKSPDFDPAKTEPRCYPTNAALLTWIGKHGWHVQSLVPLAGSFIMVKPWTAD